jgi:hypothetical protein
MNGQVQGATTCHSRLQTIFVASSVPLCYIPSIKSRLKGKYHV